MFIHVIYGEGEILLVNPDCRIIHALCFVHKKCELDPEQLLELVPVDDHEMFPMLFEQDPYQFLTSLVIDRQFYVPAYVILGKKGELTGMEPQLKDWNEKFPTLDGRIKTVTQKRMARRRRGLLPIDSDALIKHRSSSSKRMANQKKKKSFHKK